MEYRKITSHDDWIEIWLSKFIAECENRKLSADQIKADQIIVRKYLSENPGNPRAIDIKKFKKFIAAEGLAAIAPFEVFYESIARSDKHCEILTELKLVLKAKKP